MTPTSLPLLRQRPCAAGTRFGVARGQVVACPRLREIYEDRASPARLLLVASAVLCGVLVTGVACAGPPSALDADSQHAADESLPPSLWTRPEGEDWPSFLGPNRNGKSSETGLLTTWPPAGPRVVWTRNIGKGYGAGSISRGRYYHFDRVGDRARLFCLNAETGAELWAFEYPTVFIDSDSYDNGPRCSPIVDGSRVYIYGAEGMLYCLRTDDGTVVWSCDTIRQFGVLQNFFGVGSTPVVEQNLLIAIVGGSPPEDQNIPQGQLDRATGNGTGIVAFDKFTGDVKYKLTKELASYASPIVATVRDSRRCFAFCRGGLVVFFPDTGLINFRVPWPCVSLAAVNASTPVIVDNEVFISEAYGPGSCLIRVEPGGYQISWRDRKESRKKALQAAFSTPIYHAGYLYGCSGRYVGDMELRCVEWKTGAVVWSEPTHVRSSFLYADQYLINLEERGKLRLIKATPKRFELVAEVILRNQNAPPPPAADQAVSGTDVPKTPAEEYPPPLLKFPCWAAPILSHGLLYLQGRRRLVCVELMPQGK